MGRPEVPGLPDHRHSVRRTVQGLHGHRIGQLLRPRPAAGTGSDAGRSRRIPPPLATRRRGHPHAATSDAQRVVMKTPPPGSATAIFIVFFGVALLDAASGGNTYGVLFWL